MRSSDLSNRGRTPRIRAFGVSLAGSLLTLLLMLSGTADAASTWCTNSTPTTTWLGGNGSWGASSSNWSNGFPNSNCTAVISGNVTVTLTTTKRK